MRDNWEPVAVTSSHFRGIKPKLSAVSLTDRLTVCEYFLNCHPLLMPLLNWQVLPPVRTTLMCQRALLCSAGWGKVWRLAKTSGPTFLLIGNFVCILSACLSLCLSFILWFSYFFLCQFPFFYFGWGCLCGRPIRLFEFPLPHQKQGTSALKSDKHAAGGIKAMQRWNLRGS